MKPNSNAARVLVLLLVLLTLTSCATPAPTPTVETPTPAPTSSPTVTSDPLTLLRTLTARTAAPALQNTSVPAVTSTPLIATPTATIPSPTSGPTTWAKTYGGSSYDAASSIAPTNDGGYIVAGATSSFGAGGDAWVFKLDGSGSVVWQKSYGGNNYDVATIIGGYVVAGYTRSFGAGSDDAWVFKLDAAGNLVWQKTYGGSADDYADAIMPTRDGGYIVAGNRDPSATLNFDAWLLKFNGVGNVVWQKTYNEAGTNGANSIAPTSNGGYIVAGAIGAFGGRAIDAWVMKLDGAGNAVWYEIYQWLGKRWAFSIKPTPDGGYIVAGSILFFDERGSEAWVMKLNGAGKVSWQKTYGGSGDDQAKSIALTSDGGYIIAGSTKSFGAGSNDVWVLKLDGAGNVVWQTAYGGSGDDQASAIALRVMVDISLQVLPSLSAQAVGMPGCSS